MADVLVIGGDAGLGAEVLRATRSAGYAAVPCPREMIAAADDGDCDRLVAELGRHAVLDVGQPSPGDAGRLARAAARAGALSVLTSWVDVFDGRLPRPYVESDEPWPTTAAGHARLATERAVAHANERHVIFRLGWVLGISGPPIDDLVAGADGLGCPDPRTRGTPLLPADVADGIVSLVAGGAYGVFHPGGAGSCTILELARVVARALALPVRTVADLPAADGPLQQALDTRRSGAPRVRDWRLAAAAVGQLSDAPDLGEPAEAR